MCSSFCVVCQLSFGPESHLASPVAWAVNYGVLGQSQSSATLSFGKS